MTQRSYYVGWSRKKHEVLDRRKVPALNNKEYGVDELDVVIRQVFRAYPNDPAIAVAFARRLRLLAASLLDAASLFYGPL